MRGVLALKSHTCDERDLVLYTRGQLSFRKGFHERFDAAAAASTNQSNEYHKNKMGKVDGTSQDRVPLSLSGKGNGCLSLSSVDFE